MTERRRRIPPALGALLAVSTLLAIGWSCLTPAFQAPDEPAHWAYVESLGTRFALPGDARRKIYSTETFAGIAAINADQVAAQRPVKPEWGDQAERDWEAIDEHAPSDDGGGPGPTSADPPTAYALQALGYVAASSGTLFDKLLGARLMSALWLPVTVLATWLLAGEMLGRRRLLQTAAAAVPALLPMVAFISASVGPDGMLYAVWTLALWLGVRCVKQGVPVRDGAAFFALVGIACTVKATSYALIPAAVLVAVLGILARRPWRVPRVLAFAAAVAVPLALTIGIWVLVAGLLDRPAAAQVTGSAGVATAAVRDATNWRELLSYVWQYYLPRVPGQTAYSIPAIGGGYPLLQVWITQGWAAFGWLEVKFDPWVYRVLAVLTVGVGAAAAAALVRARRSVDLRAAAFLAVAVLSLLAGLHWTDYHQLRAGAGGFMQGRYLFPIVGVFGLTLAGAITLAPAARRAAVTGIAVAGLLTFHLLCIGLVLERFYA